MKNNNLLNKLFFLRKTARLRKRVNSDFIGEKYAVLPCKVNNYRDIINSYSIKDYEILSPEFADSIEEFSNYIPNEYPIILNITGCDFSDDEKNSIRKAINNYFMFNLGMSEKKVTKSRLFLLFLIVGAIISAAVIVLTQKISGVVLACLLFIIFEFFIENLIDDLMFNESKRLHKRTNAGRLSSLILYFGKENETMESIEQNVNATKKNGKE